MKSEVTIYLRGMFGLGDNIYQQPILKHLSQDRDVWLETPWPQLYLDLPRVHCLPSNTSLRMQKRNMERSEKLFTPLSVREKTVLSAHARHLSYRSWQNKGKPIWLGLCETAGMAPDGYLLGDGEKTPPDGSLVASCPVAVVRPATVRREWPAPSRNCRQEYLQWAVDWLKARDFRVVVLASIQPGEEDWAEGVELTGADVYSVQGDMEPIELLRLMNLARVVVSPVGFAAPIGMFLSTPTVIVHGGAGGYNGPNIIDAPCARPLFHVQPKNYCGCKDHKGCCCDKTIEKEVLNEALQRAVC